MAWDGVNVFGINLPAVPLCEGLGGPGVGDALGSSCSGDLRSLPVVVAVTKVTILLKTRRKMLSKAFKIHVLLL